ncbi:MAG: S24 family peptidase [Bacteroidota bacterium]
MPKSTPYHWLRITRGLKHLIKMRGWTKKKFAEVAKIFPQDVNKYLAAELNPENLLLALYEAGEDIEWIKNGGSIAKLAVKDQSPGTEPRAPLMGRIVLTPDGKEITEMLGIPAGASVPCFTENCFSLEIGNDSMIDAEPPLFPGDICIFETGRNPKKGMIAALQLRSGERVIKMITGVTRSSYLLTAANRYRQFPSITIKRSDVRSIGLFVMKVQLTEDAKRRFGLKE